MPSATSCGTVTPMSCAAFMSAEAWPDMAAFRRSVASLIAVSGSSFDASIPSATPSGILTPILLAVSTALSNAVPVASEIPWPDSLTFLATPSRPSQSAADDPNWSSPSWIAIWSRVSMPSISDSASIASMYADTASASFDGSLPSTADARSWSICAPLVPRLST